MEKELLKKLGEETMHSAKGHFKACDIRRNLVSITIWGCALLNIVGVIGVSPSIDKTLSAIGLLGTIALLIWDAGEGRDYRATHKKVAEEYLALHKEIRACFFIRDCDGEQVQKLSDKVTRHDKENKPEIPLMARRWAKKAIEKTGETDNWWE